MPEGPEASFLSATINEKYAGKKLTAIKIVSGRYTRHGAPEGYADFLKDLPARLEKVESKGKVIFFYFANGVTMISRLGMTGWWYQAGAAPRWRENTDKPNVIFEFDGTPALIYTDFRNFGTLNFTRDPTPDLDELAPSIMGAAPSIGEIPARRGEWLLEDALVDQKFLVSGIGNYLKSEILYAAEISPLRKIKDVAPEEWALILREARRISRLMLAQLYKGDPSEYIGAMKVYQRDTDPLGNKIERHTTKAGRTSFWVPQIQK